MTTVRVLELTGENAITLADGQKVYELAYPELAGGHAVALDFDGVRVFASPFFNAAVGQLLRDLTPEELNLRLRFINLNPTGRSILRAVIRNAKAYYGNPENAEAIEEALRNQALTV